MTLSHAQQLQWLRERLEPPRRRSTPELLGKKSDLGNARIAAHRALATAEKDSAQLNAAAHAVERAVAAATSYDVERAAATTLEIRGPITEKQRDRIVTAANDARKTP